MDRISLRGRAYSPMLYIGQLPVLYGTFRKMAQCLHLRSRRIKRMVDAAVKTYIRTRVEYAANKRNTKDHDNQLPAKVEALAISYVDPCTFNGQIAAKLAFLGRVDLMVIGNMPEAEARTTFVQEMHFRRIDADLKPMEKLQAFSDNEIFSPRVKAITEAVRTIARGFPEEGIVVIVLSVLFLDNILEAITRLSQEEIIFQFKVSEYKGTLKVPERANIISNFNKADGLTRVLLASSGDGGTGVNMYGASHLIRTSPFWTPVEGDQTKGRVYRLRQKREVHIWEVVSSGVMFDTLSVRSDQVQSANFLSRITSDDTEAGKLWPLQMNIKGEPWERKGK
ncbi:unnamed protein product [Clonostachys byssicola]|uniref:Helicase C-terminal domain-containing protein n=1 Tax=Clonostachys byssicola TaxID=160290 RepID=A0A9N9YC38_9HYPO|nr:unnamed protein product [Clonostachys byssicola]